MYACAEASGPLPNGHPVQTATADRTAEDALTAYLAEVARHPLLTADEERALARRARAGDPVATQRLTLANLRLVISLARRYAGLGLALADLIQEGNQGLMRAVAKFDPERGTRFTTHATWWIRQSLVRGLAQGSLIRLPPYIHTRARAVEKAVREQADRDERAAGDSGVASKLSLTPEQVRTTRLATQPVVSIDASGGETRTFCDVLHPSGAADPLEESERRSLRAHLERCLAAIPPREAEVVRLRFGLDRSPMTLDEVGRSIGVTRERVRQLEARALDRLRASAGARGLELFLGR